MEIKRAALLGAGGIGSYFVWGMSKALGENFSVIADGARAERLKREGLDINGEHFPLNVKTAQEAAGCDLLIVAVKYYNLASVLDTIRELVGAQTIVISLLNGVDSEESLRRR